MGQSFSKMLIIPKLVKEFPAFKNSEVHFRIPNSPPLDSILNQIDPVHTLTYCSFGINVNDRSSIPGRGKDFSLSCSDRLWGPHGLLANEYRCAFPGEKSRVV
jgi:hypothetical protein